MVRRSMLQYHSCSYMCLDRFAESTADLFYHPLDSIRRGDVFDWRSELLMYYRAIRRGTLDSGE